MIKIEIGSDIAGRAIELYESVNQRTSGWLAVLVRAFMNFNRRRATLAAAGISFYSLLSFLPLLIFTITILSIFIDLPVVQKMLHGWLTASLPLNYEDLIEGIQSFVTAHDSLNLIALAGFLWAASGMFNAIVVNVNYAWGINKAWSAVRSRVIALLFVTSLAIIFVLLLILLLLVRLALGLFLGFWDGIGLRILPLLIQSLLTFLLYKVGPFTKVSSKAALVGGIVASVAIELTTSVYSWYLTSQWSSYQVLYGSLGAIFGLFIWVYLSNLILLFCAYLTEAIQARWSSENPAWFSEPLNIELASSET